MINCYEIFKEFYQNPTAYIITQFFPQGSSSYHEYKELAFYIKLTSFPTYTCYGIARIIFIGVPIVEEFKILSSRSLSYMDPGILL